MSLRLGTLHLNSEFAYCFRRILRLEATTALLESKLDSVARSRGEAGRVFFFAPTELSIAVF